MRHPGAYSRSSILGLLGLCLFLSAMWLPLSGRAQERENPEVILKREFGLTRRAKGEVWFTPLEAALRRRLDSLSPRVQHARDLQQAIIQHPEQNLALWSQRQAAEQALKKKLNQLSPSDPQRKPLEEELRHWELKAVAPNKLGGAPWVQPDLVRMTTLRNEILLDVFAIRRDADRLKDQYAQLAENERLQAALSTMGERHRLGPLMDYEPEVRGLERVEKFLYSLPQPLYLQSGHLRLGAILNERTPITFTWCEESDPTVLTAGIAQAAGVQPEAGSQEITISCAGQRRLQAKRVVLTSLRFGKYVLKDVEAYVLPPEGEDHGARIGPAAFRGYRVFAEPAWLRFRIEPAE